MHVLWLLTTTMILVRCVLYFAIHVIAKSRLLNSLSGSSEPKYTCDGTDKWCKQPNWLKGKAIKPRAPVHATSLARAGMAVQVLNLQVRMIRGVFSVRCHHEREQIVEHRLEVLPSFQVIQVNGIRPRESAVDQQLPVFIGKEWLCSTGQLRVELLLVEDL